MSWDERYGVDHWIYGTEPNDFLAAHADRIPAAGRVLCLGDGEGRNGVFLAGRGHRVTSLDASAVGLAKAERLARERGVELATVHADLARWTPGPEAWDAVVCVFLHLPAGLRRRVHADAAAALAPGGVLLLEAYTPGQIGRGTGGPPDPALMMTLDDLRTELAGLRLEVGREVEREIREGTKHTGSAAVVQVVAVKPESG